ncbi:hypothetical protein VNI00_019389 [Paramarasmius palmivorus]|uniref:Uncharacterized protein n=1 Tax=Paramarasmius palmivorus TaxID=297713 RepID=A0AAW0ANX0_9AGAR
MAQGFFAQGQGIKRLRNGDDIVIVSGDRQGRLEDTDSSLDGQETIQEHQLPHIEDIYGFEAPVSHSNRWTRTLAVMESCIISRSSICWRITKYIC